MISDLLEGETGAETRARIYLLLPASPAQCPKGSPTALLTRHHVFRQACEWFKLLIARGLQGASWCVGNAQGSKACWECFPFFSFPKFAHHSLVNKNVSQLTQSAFQSPQCISSKLCDVQSWLFWHVGIDRYAPGSVTSQSLLLGGHFLPVTQAPHRHCTLYPSNEACAAIKQGRVIKGEKLPANMNMQLWKMTRSDVKLKYNDRRTISHQEDDRCGQWPWWR